MGCSGIIRTRMRNAAAFGGKWGGSTNWRGNLTVFGGNWGGSMNWRGNFGVFGGKCGGSN